ncbi:Uncharacterised protein g6458 [Pycnogonum litorale]
MNFGHKKYGLNDSLSDTYAGLESAVMKVNARNDFCSSNRDSNTNGKVDTLLKRSLTCDIYREIRHYEPCIIGQVLHHMVITNDNLYLVEYPNPKSVRRFCSIQEIISVHLVEDEIQFLSEDQRKSAQHIRISCRKQNIDRNVVAKTGDEPSHDIQESSSDLNIPSNSAKDKKATIKPSKWKRMKAMLHRPRRVVNVTNKTVEVNDVPSRSEPILGNAEGSDKSSSEASEDKSGDKFTGKSVWKSLLMRNEAGLTTITDENTMKFVSPGKSKKNSKTSNDLTMETVNCAHYNNNNAVVTSEEHLVSTVANTNDGTYELSTITKGTKEVVVSSSTGNDIIASYEESNDSRIIKEMRSTSQCLESHPINHQLRSLNGPLMRSKTALGNYYDLNKMTQNMVNVMSWKWKINSSLNLESSCRNITDEHQRLRLKWQESKTMSLKYSRSNQQSISGMVSGHANDDALTRIVNHEVYVWSPTSVLYMILSNLWIRNLVKETLQIPNVSRQKLCKIKRPNVDQNVELTYRRICRKLNTSHPVHDAGELAFQLKKLNSLAKKYFSIKKLLWTEPENVVNLLQNLKSVSNLWFDHVVRQDNEQEYIINDKYAESLSTLLEFFTLAFNGTDVVQSRTNLLRLNKYNLLKDVLNIVIVNIIKTYSHRSDGGHNIVFKISSSSPSKDLENEVTVDGIISIIHTKLFMMMYELLLAVQHLDYLNRSSKSTESSVIKIVLQTVDNYSCMKQLLSYTMNDIVTMVKPAEDNQLYNGESVVRFYVNLFIIDIMDINHPLYITLSTTYNEEIRYK